MRVTLSQDILGICLILSAGDLNMNLGKIVRLAEEFQEKNNRHFGITRNDFRNLLIKLIWEKFPGSVLNATRLLHNVTLEEVALHMLSFEDTHFNDEGENWCSLNEEQKLGGYYIREIFDGDANAYLDKLSLKRIMVNFFQNLDERCCPVNEVVELMAMVKITKDILYACSRSGESS
jgi:hypothetical protein